MQKESLGSLFVYLWCNKCVFITKLVSDYSTFLIGMTIFVIAESFKKYV